MVLLSISMSHIRCNRLQLILYAPNVICILHTFLFTNNKFDTTLHLFKLNTKMCTKQSISLNDKRNGTSPRYFS